MHRADLGAVPCSLSRTLQIVGEWWSLLVLRDVTMGWTRFDEIHGHLGIARNILKARLDTLVEQGMVERRRYQERPERYEYVPTEKALDFFPALLALVAWGDRWTAFDGPPILFTHDTCGHDMHAAVVCSACSEPFSRNDLSFRPGPGLPDPSDAAPPIRSAG